MVLIFLIAGSAVTGCAVAPSNPWDDVEVDLSPAVRPDRLPDRPIPVVHPDGFLYDREGLQALDEYFTLAEAAEDIAHLNADEIDQLKRASKALIEAGQAQRRQTEITKDILEDERRHHAWEKAGLYVIMLLGLGAATL